MVGLVVVRVGEYCFFRVGGVEVWVMVMWGWVMGVWSWAEVRVCFEVHGVVCAKI